MSLDTELVQFNYESGLMSLASGLEPEILIVIMEQMAEEGDLEVAQGMKQALEDWLYAHAQGFNARLGNMYNEENPF